MTVTLFHGSIGQNETTDDAPGRGGYSKVIVPLPKDEAIEWWENEYDDNPERIPRYPEYGADRQAWDVTEFEDDEDARKQCGEKTLQKGGIGSPMTEHYTWDELNGRLDVRVVSEDEL
jgi:hypothetical protein